MASVLKIKKNQPSIFGGWFFVAVNSVQEAADKNFKDVKEEKWFEKYWR